MALIPAKISKKGIDAAIEGVSQFLEPQLADSGSSLRSSIASHDLAAPQEVYTLDLSNFSKGLKGAKATGWRYLVMNGEEVIAAAELDRPSKGSTEAPTFSNVNTGGFVSSSLAAIKSAEDLVEVRDYDFQTRLLQIPAIHVVALWLHRKDQDLLIRLESAESDAVRSGKQKSISKAVSPDVFFSSLSEQAHLIAQFDDTPEASLKLAKADAKKGASKKNTKPSDKRLPSAPTKKDASTPSAKKKKGKPKK